MVWQMVMSTGRYLVHDEYDFEAARGGEGGRLDARRQTPAERILGGQSGKIPLDSELCFGETELNTRA